MRQIAGGLLSCALLSSSLARAAEATGQAQPRAEAAASEPVLRARRQLLERAKERFEAGRGSGEEARQQLEGALDALRLAYQLTPAPWLLFNLAQVKSRLGACQDAAQLYQRFLSSDPTPEARASAEQAMKLLGQCTEPAPPSMDDGLEPALQPVTSQRLLARVEDRLSPAGLSPASAPPPPPESGPGVWPWIFGGLALSSAIASAIFYADAVDAKRDLDRLRVGGPAVARTQQRGESAQAAARVFGGFTLGFALATGASLWPWLIADDAPERPQPGRPRVVGAGASYSFEF